MSCTYCTPKHLTNNEKNIEIHFAYEDGDSDYGHMNATHVDIIIFFAKPNGSIDHLIGYKSVKKKISYWYLRLYEEQMFALVPKDIVLFVDSATTYTILKSNKFFSCLIMETSMLVLFIVLQIYLKALEELLYFYQEVE